MRRQLIAGNWKMHGSAAEMAEFDALRDALPDDAPDVLVCPPATLIQPLAARAGRIAVGGQDCHPEAKGAHTGDLSAEMLREAGASAVIVGHSERRTAYGESDGLVRTKAEAARRAGLTAIVCVGESGEDRDAGRTLGAVLGQVRGSLPPDSNGENTAVAYEPVWAIGSGRTPTVEEIREVHAAIHATMRETGADGVRVLYGGSVSPDNCAEILQIEGVDGVLGGDVSLTSAKFLPIVEAAA